MTGYAMTVVVVSFCLLTAQGVADSDSSKEQALKAISAIQFNIKPDNYVMHGTRNDEQDAVDSRLWGGVNMKKAAKRIGERMRDLANDELGVTTLQGVFDSISYADEELNLQSHVSQIGEKMSSKLSAYRQLVLNNKALVQSLYKFHKRSPISQGLSCCQLNSSFFSDQRASDEGRSTSMHTVCDLLPSNVRLQLSFNPGRNLTAKFSQNVQRYPALKWQYFISTEGIHNEFPAHQMNTSSVRCTAAHGYRHREVFVSTVSPQPKNVVIVIDTSSALTPNQMKSAQELARQTLMSLSYTDKVAVLSLSRSVGTSPSVCDASSLSAATDITKYYLSQYIDKLSQGKALANHTLGLRTAFSVMPKGEAGVIVYVSKGSLNSITEPKEALTVIAQGNAQHAGRVVIHTYGLVDDTTIVMYEMTFLQDIAMQNFTKYGVTYAGSPVTPGTYNTACCADTAAAALNHLFTPKAINEGFLQSHTSISNPYNDLVDRELVVSMTAPCVSVDDRSLIGLVGVDISLRDLTDTITHTNRQGLYAFLVNQQGYMIMHPNIERSIHERDSPTLIKLEHYETLPGIEPIVRLILTTRNGTAELRVGNQTVAGESMMSPYSLTYVYSWYKVQSTPYIVVMRALKSSSPAHKVTSVLTADSDGMVYHRLDLGQLPSEETCLHFQQLASFSTSALFLSARAFEKPYEHISQPETKKMVANYLAYISDSTTYISKPGLKEGVKTDVIAISRINKHWLQQWKSSKYTQFIARRYIATPSGAFRMFPATLIRKLYDPTQSHWYKQASRLPGRIVLTRPHIDAAGSGFTVTLSHSVYEGRSAALHTPRDPIAAVMGADFPTSYFQRLLLEVIPTCEARAMRCFMMDDRGYIITHPYVNISSFRRSFERQHLTHVEPLVANDILGHKSLVSKQQCNSFTDRTVQRYYHFNTSFMGTLTNLKAGEQCVRYQMSLVPGTNAFVVMVNETCELRMSAFCPCSITDRLCLNCQRMEQSECECPCECSLTSDTCTGDLDPAEVAHPSCDLFTESNVLFKLPKAITTRLARCVEPRCAHFKSKRSCMGVVGCAWCEKDVNGVTTLTKDYCAIQRACFGGVLGARTPYNDQIAVPSSKETHHTLLKNTPVGPVTGAILGAVLMIVLGVYCYRHNIHRRPLSDMTIQDTSHCSGGYNQDIDGYVYHELPAVPGPSAAIAGHLNLAEMELPAHISPYHINENYRPPRPVLTTTESSDHGYSTMTAHEEAESSSSASCKESLVSSTQAKQDNSSVPCIRILPPPSKGTRNASRHKQHDRECRKLLLADCNLRDVATTLPRTIAEQPEFEKT